MMRENTAVSVEMEPVHVRNLTHLNWGFMFLFFLAAGLQNFLTMHFAKLGEPRVGYILLGVLYGSILLVMPVTQQVLRYLGKRQALLLSACCYLFAGFAAAQEHRWMLYLGFALMGAGGALLWYTQRVVLFESSTHQNIGHRAGQFKTLLAAGSLLGIAIFGVALSYFSFQSIVFWLSVVASVSLYFFARLQLDDSIERTAVNLTLVRTPKYLMASMVSFFGYFLLSLSFSFLPLVAYEATQSSLFVTLISLLFLAVEFMFSAMVGRWIDKKGAQKVYLLAGVLALVGFLILYIDINSVSLILATVLLGISSVIQMTTAMILPKLIAPQSDQPAVAQVFLYAKYAGILCALGMGALGSNHVLLGAAFVISICIILFRKTIVSGPKALQV